MRATDAYYDGVAFALTIFCCFSLTAMYLSELMNMINNWMHCKNKKQTVIGQCKLKKELQGYFSLASPVQPQILIVIHTFFYLSSFVLALFPVTIL